MMERISRISSIKENTTAVSVPFICGRCHLAQANQECKQDLLYIGHFKTERWL